MPQNVFKIYDGRNYFWQWDTNQKLIVLDETVDEVHFSNRDMTHAISKDVFVDKDGKRVCCIPDILLTLPKNLIAAAIVTDDNATKTLKQVKFAVQKRTIPSDYVVSDNIQSEDITDRLNIVEEFVEDMRLNLPNSYDAKGSAEQALADAKLYMAENYDKIGYAESVMNNLTEEIARAKNEEAAITRVLHKINDIVTDTQSDVDALEKLVGESSVVNQIKNAINDLDISNTYDIKGSASSALADAKKYMDDQVQSYDEVIQNKLNEEIDRAKNEEAAITRAVTQVNDGLASAKKDITSNATNINVLKGGENVHGSVANALVEAKLYADALAKNYDVAGSAASVQNQLTEEVARAKNEETAITRAIHQINDRVAGIEESIDTKIAEAVAKIMDNPDETLNSINELVDWVKNNSAKSKIATVTLFTNSWVGDASPYSQVVTVNDVTENSKIDLQPTALQIVTLQDAEIVLTAENNAGITTVWAIGNKPTEDMEVQVEITEVIQA